MAVDKELITVVRCCWNCRYRDRYNGQWVCIWGNTEDNYSYAAIAPHNLCPFHEDRSEEVTEKLSIPISRMGDIWDVKVNE